MKVREFIQSHRAWLMLALLLLSVVVGGVGCGTPGDEPDNLSSRPWNSPEGWQNGALPSMMQSPH